METAYGDEVRITGLSDEELGRLSSDLGLSLSLTEMKMLQSYFRNLGREPTMVEVQAMAQAWSEHCCYKSSKFYLKRYLSGLKSHTRSLPWRTMRELLSSMRSTPTS